MTRLPSLLAKQQVGSLFKHVLDVTSLRTSETADAMTRDVIISIVIPLIGVSVSGH
jgi:hypothetical protein